MKKERQYSTPCIIWRACLQYIKTSKAWSLLEQGIAVIHALSLTAIIFTTQVLFDAATSASVGGGGFLAGRFTSWGSSYNNYYTTNSFRGGRICF